MCACVRKCVCVCSCGCVGVTRGCSRGGQVIVFAPTRHHVEMLQMVLSMVCGRGAALVRARAQ